MPGGSPVGSLQMTYPSAFGKPTGASESRRCLGCGMVDGLEHWHYSGGIRRPDPGAAGAEGGLNSEEAWLGILQTLRSALGGNPSPQVRLKWLSKDRFRLAGLKFQCRVGNYDKRTTEQRIVLLKPKVFLDTYLSLLERVRAKNVLEFGIWQGGSALFLAAAGKLDRLVGIDIGEPLPAVQSILANHPVGRSVRLHFNTSQDDIPRVRSIVESEFGATPLDMIVDDASHFYAETRASFQATFGYLRPGGVYVIEDWGWAHWPEWQDPNHIWREREALSNLLFEITMAIGSKARQIAKIEILSGAMVVITRGHGLAHGAPFDLSQQILARGRQLNRI